MSEEQQTQPEVAEELIDAATEAVSVQSRDLDELTGGARTGEPLGMANLMDVPVCVTVEVGRTRVPLSELMEVGPGSLLPLDRESHEPVDVLVNGKVVARGEVVTLNGAFGVRITNVDDGAAG